MIKSKGYCSVFKLSKFFLLVFLLLSFLLSTGCSPISNLLFGAPGFLEVSTYPSGAKIFLNGSDTGHLTPYTIPNLPKGAYEVKVVLGEISYAKTVIVYANNTSNLYKDLLLRLNKIMVEPASMNLTVGESKNIASVAAYYIDSGSVNLVLSDCSYSSSSSQVTVSSSGIITGVSAGSATITISYTDLEITKMATINITVKPAIVTLSAISGVTPPLTGNIPVTTITETAQYTGSITWLPIHIPFQAVTGYIATISLIPKTGFTLTGVTANFFTVEGSTSDNNSIDSGVVTAVFPTTTAVEITSAGVTGFEAPVTGGTAQVFGNLTADTATYTVTNLIWAPADSIFAATTAYTATVELTSAPGNKFPAAGFEVPTANGGGTVSTGVTSGGDVSGNILSFTILFPVTAVAPLEVGDNYGGGKVAYILQPGETINDASGNLLYSYDANVQHGLIAAIADQSSGIRWYKGVYLITGATAIALGTGSDNTTKIITVQGEVAISYAAGVASAYSSGTYNDWYLPSKDELNKLYLNRLTLGGFAGSYYWSSSESSSSSVRYKSFGDGSQGSSNKNSLFHVRAVRSF